MSIAYGSVMKSLWLKSTLINKQLNNSLSYVHGIGLSEYMVLNSLFDSPNKTMTRIDLAESIGRTASGVTKMLLPMEKIGLIQKESGARDARVSLVKISKPGERLFKDATTTLDQSSKQILSKLNSKQTSEFLSCLDLLQD
ncbi:MAG: MarR family transcriptional regulator [SAR86 cluster bacterium]|uniref:MarR family transcriptional regulator n=1 Tax=SAR86 cluster bacterium TaxID=2030880 RepID=A0A2A4X4X2_9GAMM|nr:MAG: MarR family transcriptional regulator [SAR86 cluster bacterium]